MDIGNKILELRKKNNFSQEQLAEKMKVARQTISKWELGETSPDIKQAKELSKIFNVSLDELVDNDIKDLVIEKVSNTEKLAGIIIKILKIIGIAFIVLFIIDIIACILFNFIRPNNITIKESSIDEIEMQCSIDDEDYIINVGTDGYFNCSSCSKEIQKYLKDNYIDFGDLSKTENNINDYFKKNNGSCD